MTDDPRINPMAPGDFLQRHQQILEDFFGAEWFLTPHNHPAYTRWKFLRTLSERSGILHYPEEADALPLIAHIMSDAVVLIELSGGSVPELAPGSIRIPESLRFRLLLPEAFEDFMVEVMAAGSLVGPDREVHLVERKGWPTSRCPQQEPAQS